MGAYDTRIASVGIRPQGRIRKLKELMDIFYCQAYSVWQGEVERSRLKTDAEQTFALLKQRPGLFARSLFANMLWFGPKETLTHSEKSLICFLPV